MIFNSPSLLTLAVDQPVALFPLPSFDETPTPEFIADVITQNVCSVQGSVIRTLYGQGNISGPAFPYEESPENIQSIRASIINTFYAQGNVAGCTDCSIEQTIPKKSPVPGYVPPMLLPGAPYNVVATALDNFTISTTWTDASGSITSRNGRASTNGGNSWTLTTNINQPWVFPSIADTVYFVQIQDTNNIGPGAWSKTFVVSTSPPPPTTISSIVTLGFNGYPSASFSTVYRLVTLGFSIGP
jgi:hypothetical protein